MLATDIQHQLDIGHPCVRIVTNDEPEAIDAAFGVAAKLGLAVYAWSSVKGLQRWTATHVDSVPDTDNPAAALAHLLLRVQEPLMLIALDLAQHLDDARTLRCLRELIEGYRSLGRQRGTEVGQKREGDARAWSRVVMIDHKSEVPVILGYLSVRVEAVLPDDATLERVVRRTLKSLHTHGRLKEATITASGLANFVEMLRGTSERQAEQLVTAAVVDDGKLNAEDMRRIAAAKRELIEDTGVLEYVQAAASLDDIGGMAGLKSWLLKREASFHPSSVKLGLPPPRGVLLLGVPGAGKSLAAKAIATAWRRPLMRLDPGVLFDKFIGESEKRLRDALSQAEAMSPIVLWIDEIEKGFAGSASSSVDGGLSRRMFGSLLTWMQEHRAPVFVVATANDVDALPPELLRKGRFDELFFVDLPGPEARRLIVEIHLKKRAQDVARFDIACLTEACAGFSGAEIEQAVISSMHEWNERRLKQGAEAAALCTADVERTMRTSPPLSVTAAERVGALRQWARGRCVSAD